MYLALETNTGISLVNIFWDTKLKKVSAVVMSCKGQKWVFRPFLHLLLLNLLSSTLPEVPKPESVHVQS